MKNKIASLVLLTTAGLTASYVANAQSSDESDTSNGHGYVTAGAGYGTVDLGPSVASPQGSFVWNVGAGYLWQKGDFAFGPELSYTAFPSIHYNQFIDTKIYGNSINIMAAGHYSLTRKVKAVGKVGPALTTQVYTAAGNSTTSTRLIPSMYVGLAYTFNENVDLNAGYQYVAGAAPMYAMLAGASFNF